MCGIAGFIVKDLTRPFDREALLDELLHGIDPRGGDATGFVARNREGIVEWHKASTDARGFIPHRRRLPLDADVVIGHTRWATNGHQAFPENNHPVKRGPMFVTHNGVIYNDGAIFRATSRTPYGQVDSEAIAALLAAVGTLDERVGVTFSDIDGSAAIAAMDERDGTVLLARISGSPLYVLTTRRVAIWASTAKAAENAHKLVIGSLGRARAKALDEGDAIVYREGVASTFTFEPPRWLYVAPKASPLPSKETTGSYLPASAGATGTTTPYRDHCEICGGTLDDPYDLWDDNDYYEVCGPCWDAYSDPRDRHTVTYADRLAYATGWRPDAGEKTGDGMPADK